MTTPQNPQPDVAIIGAGVAGLAAAVALARDGARVTLLERRPFVGGRAYSYPHPALNETIDSQHVILGCCTNFTDLIAQANAASSIRWYDTLTFLEPRPRRHCHPERSEGPASHPRHSHSHAGRSPGEESPHLQTSTLPPPSAPTTSIIRPSPLPAPFHNSFSFLRAPMLNLRDKSAIARGLMHFLRGYPADDTESFATWLTRTGQTERAIRHFWEPIILGALNDTFANCSTRYAGKVFHESFLRSPQAGRLGIPTLPLSEFFAPVATYACSLGVDLRLNTGVTALTPLPGNRWRISTSTGKIDADAVILATNLREANILITAVNTPSRLDTRTNSGLQASDPMPQTEPASAPEPFGGSSGLQPAENLPNPEGALAPGTSFTQFTTAPITTIHLWYDREITPLDHAVLLDTRIQWLFNKSRIRRWHPDRGTYLELVISASHTELKLSREQILASALAELELFFPQIRTATLLKSAVLKEARATFSVTPGLDPHRPTQRTAYPNLFLAGDYTATNWPSTMEGAIRSGRLAAALAAATSPSTPNPDHYLAPELPATGLMGLFSL